MMLQNSHKKEFDDLFKTLNMLNNRLDSVIDKIDCINEKITSGIATPVLPDIPVPDVHTITFVGGTSNLINCKVLINDTEYNSTDDITLDAVPDTDIIIKYIPYEYYRFEDIKPRLQDITIPGNTATNISTLVNNVYTCIYHFTGNCYLKLSGQANLQPFNSDNPDEPFDNTHPDTPCILYKTISSFNITDNNKYNLTLPKHTKIIKLVVYLDKYCMGQINSNIAQYYDDNIILIHNEKINNMCLYRINDDDEIYVEYELWYTVRDDVYTEMVKQYSTSASTNIPEKLLAITHDNDKDYTFNFVDNNLISQNQITKTQIITDVPKNSKTLAFGTSGLNKHKDTNIIYICKESGSL